MIRPPEEMPFVTGPHGTAWKVPMGQYEDRTMSSVWIVHSPQSCPPFHWKLVSCVVLDPDRWVDHGREPNVWWEGCTHEIVTFSLDPTRSLPDLDALDEPALMVPPDDVVQFDGMTDEQAEQVLEIAVSAVCYGTAYPCDCTRRRWNRFLVVAAEQVKMGLTPRSVS